MRLRSPPDGYTVSFGHLGTHVANGAIYKLGYDLVADLDPVVLLPSNTMIVVSKNAVPAKSLTELLAWLKAQPKPAAAGTAGAGSGSHIAGLYFENITGIKLQYVPYRGTGPAMNDLVAGQIDLIVDQLSNSINQVRAGTIRGYAVTDTKRAESASDIPTADEAGLPGFHMTLSSGLWVPKGTPKEIIAKLNAAAVEALNDPGVRKQLENLGLQMPPKDQLSPQALGDWQKAEIAKWWPMIKAANVKVPGGIQMNALEHVATCQVCGCAPWASRSFCRACIEQDRTAARRRKPDHNLPPKWDQMSAEVLWSHLNDPRRHPIPKSIIQTFEYLISQRDGLGSELFSQSEHRKSAVT